MGYIHALEVLPQELVEQIQKYVDGQVLYIPKIKSKRCRWGKRQMQEHISRKETLKYITAIKMAWLSRNCQRNIS